MLAIWMGTVRSIRGRGAALQVERAKPGDVFERPLGVQASIIERLRAMNPTGAKQ